MVCACMWWIEEGRETIGNGAVHFWLLELYAVQEAICCVLFLRSCIAMLC